MRFVRCIPLLALACLGMTRPLPAQTSAPDQVRLLVFPVEFNLKEGQPIYEDGKKSIVYKPSTAFMTIGNADYHAKQLVNLVHPEHSRFWLVALEDSSRHSAERKMALEFSPVILHPVYKEYRILETKELRKTGKIQVHVQAEFQVDISENGRHREKLYSSRLDSVLESASLRDACYSVSKRFYRQMLADSAQLYKVAKAKQEACMKTYRGDAFNLPLPAPLVAGKDLLKRIKASVYTVESSDGFGSGWLVHPDGYLITNYHVVDSDTDRFFTLVSVSGEKIKAHIVKQNPVADLALLKADGPLNGQALRLVDKDSLSEGETLYAIGTPMDRHLGQSVSRGSFSGRRTIEQVELIQTDAAVNSGNSGGPLINDRGEVVGVVAGKMRSSVADNIGFAIPADVVLRELNLHYEKRK